MKKILALVCMMAVALTLSMGTIGCGDKGKDTKDTKTTTKETKDGKMGESTKETKAETPK